MRRILGILPSKTVNVVAVLRPLKEGSLKTLEESGLFEKEGDLLLENAAISQRILIVVFMTFLVEELGVGREWILP